MNILALLLAAVVTLSPDGNKDRTKEFLAAAKSGNEVILEAGEYHFHRKSAANLSFYVSNHDQPKSRKVFLPIEGKENLTIKGKGAKFIFHGRGMGILLRDTKNVTLSGISVDWNVPTIGEAVITDINAKGEVAAEWVVQCCWPKPNAMMLWDKDTHSIVPGTGDNCDLTKAKVGDRISYRTWERPNPAVCLYRATDTIFKDFVIHSAYGMGILAQRSTNVSIIGGGVYPREGSFTSTMADATHFSNCRGLIVSNGATYAGMMDDAINVHSTCLKIVEKTGPKQILCEYMHHQAIGFEVFEKGERIRVIRAPILTHGAEMTVEKVEMLDPRHVLIDYSLTDFGEDPAFDIGDAVENATFQPAVNFVENTVKNNRARGALFTTPKPVLVEGNLFENVSGTAILFAGDASGWYESGACEDVVIRGNSFINCLTSRYQFCEAVITAYPMVRELERQPTAYHKNIRIEDNVFRCPGKPLYYFLSTDDITYLNNIESPAY